MYVFYLDDNEKSYRTSLISTQDRPGRIAKIIQENDEYVAVEGIEENQKYVSDEPYKAKSMVLKSSLGEHGH